MQGNGKIGIPPRLLFRTNYSIDIFNSFICFLYFLCMYVFDKNNYI